MYIDDQILIRARANVKTVVTRFLLMVLVAIGELAALQQILQQDDLGVNHVG